tara:strand:- start:237 stop:392 length:156 start_codon:yes stop_codon:yes gene_type:complete
MKKLNHKPITHCFYFLLYGSEFEERMTARYNRPAESQFRASNVTLCTLIEQ